MNHVAPSDRAQLHAKLAEAMGAVGRVPKNGTNSFHNYKFATEADVSEAIRTELSDRGVAVLVSSRLIGKNHTHTPGGKDTIHTDVEVTVTFAYGDAEVSITSVGTGDDPSDKGTYKAITGAVKYALMKTFLVPTGDDPENHEQHQGDTSTPVRSASPAPSNGGGASGEFIWPFGKEKGQPISQVPDSSLTWFLANRIPDPGDEKWFEKNQRDYAIVKAEAAKRGVGAVA